MTPVNSDEHSAKRYARGGQKQPLAQRASRQVRGILYLNQKTKRENKGGDVKRTGMQ